jgi:hypothetical protein
MAGMSNSLPSIMTHRENLILEDRDNLERTKLKKLDILEDIQGLEDHQGLPLMNSITTSPITPHNSTSILNKACATKMDINKMKRKQQISHKETDVCRVPKVLFPMTINV